MSKRNKILAIDPGTRHMGFALFDRSALVHYGVRTIQSVNSPHQKLKEGRKAILRLINDLKPDGLVVEKTFFANNRNSALLNVFADEVKAVGKRKGLEVRSFAANTVRKFVCGNGAASKDDVSKVIAARYPEMKAYLSHDRRWKDEYHQNMFDAVALGLFAINQPNGK